jgi:hypothetical protein
MNARDAVGIPINYEDFSEPHSGLAAMILVQAVSDLGALGVRETMRRDGDFICKGEILAFLRSSWALELARLCGLETRKLQVGGAR